MRESTIQIIGKENFLKICKKFFLNKREIEVLRNLFEKWDRISEPIGSLEREAKKLIEGAEELVKIPEERRDRFLAALSEVSRLYAILGKERH